MIFFTACTSKKKVITDDFATDASEVSTAADQGFSDDDLSLDEAPAIATNEGAATDKQASEELSLEKELQAATNQTPAPEMQPPAELTPPAPVVTTVETPSSTVTTDVPVAAISTSAEPTQTQVSKSVEKITQIKDVQFKSNDSGGAFMLSPINNPQPTRS